MSLLHDAFARAKSENRAALIAYLPAGYPTEDGAVECIAAMVEGGVDIVEIGLDVAQFGKSSLVLKCEVRNMMTREKIITIDNITMVNLGEDGKPKPHGKTQIEFIEDRLKK